jgi:hypothetical protein
MWTGKVQEDGLDDVKHEFISNDVGDGRRVVFTLTLEMAPEVA